MMSSQKFIYSYLHVLKFVLKEQQKKKKWLDILFLNLFKIIIFIKLKILIKLNLLEKNL